MQPSKIKYRVGDLIAAAQNGEVNAIAHGCNCFNTMKSGIAPLVAAAFPEAWQADQKTVKGNREKLGRMTVGYVPRLHLHVFNLYTQYGYWGRREGLVDLDYRALNSALLALKHNLLAGCEEDEKDLWEMIVGLPKIGAGLAGGDWDIIFPMIEEHLSDFTTFIYVLKESDIVTTRKVRP